MSRKDLELPIKPELIEVQKLQRPAKTLRTSSTLPSVDRKSRLERSPPNGAKPGHESHKRVLSPDPVTVVDRRLTGCPDNGLSLPADLPAEVELKAVPTREGLFACEVCHTRLVRAMAGRVVDKPNFLRKHSQGVRVPGGVRCGS